jgi:hypothetical protein
MFYFEWCSLTASLINLLLFTVLLVREFAHHMPMSRHPGMSVMNNDMIVTFAIVCTLIFFSPWISMPYWLGLLIGRRQHVAWRGLYYTYCVLFALTVLGHVVKYGEATFGSLCLILETATLAAALFLMNESTARAWYAEKDLMKKRAEAGYS